jgi:nitrogen fixation/metabolism regulation signal transduction histidine kinase
MSNPNDHYVGQGSSGTDDEVRTTNADTSSSYTGKDENEERAQSNDQSRKSSFTDRLMNKVSPGSRRETNEYSELVRISNNVTKIIISLFLLVGFIVLVTAIFVAVIGNTDGQQSQILGNVFVAAIVGGFTIVGTIIYQVRGR